jgi:hypothetical protein
MMRENIASAAPVHVGVRQRVLEHAAAPHWPRLPRSSRIVLVAFERGNSQRRTHGVASAVAANTQRTAYADV